MNDKNMKEKRGKGALVSGRNHVTHYLRLPTAGLDTSSTVQTSLPADTEETGKIWKGNLGLQRHNAYSSVGIP